MSKARSQTAVLGRKPCSRKSLALGSLCLAWALTSPLQAWDSVHPVVIDDSAPPAALQIAVGADGSYWLGVEHKAGLASIDHYAADSRLLSRQFMPERDEWEATVEVPTLLPQADGSMLGTEFFCGIWRISAGGTLRFRSNDFYPPGSSYCDSYAITASGAVWMAQSAQLADGVSLRRRDAAGRDLGVVSPAIAGFVGTSTVLAVPGSESVWFAGYAQDDTSRQALVAEVRADGSVARQWRSPADWEHVKIEEIAAMADGKLMAIGDDVSTAGIWVAQLDPSGSSQWRQIDQQFQGVKDDGLLVASSGWTVIVGSGAQELGDGLLLLDSSFALRGRYRLPDDRRCIAQARACGASIGADGRVQLILRDAATADAPLRLLTLSPSGTPLDERSLRLQRADEIDALPAGGWLLRNADQLYRVASDGTLSALTIAPGAPQLSSNLLGEYRAQGERYAGFASGAGYLLARIDDQGQVLWQRKFAGEVDNDRAWSERAVQVVGPRVCVFDEREIFVSASLYCLDRATGAVAFEHRFPPYFPVAWGSFANGELALLDRDASGALVLRRRNLATGGERVPVALPAYAMGFDIVSGLVQPRLRSDLLRGESLALVGELAGSGGVVASWLDAVDVQVRTHALPAQPQEFWPLNGRLYRVDARRLDVLTNALDLRVLEVSSGNDVLAGNLGAYNTNVGFTLHKTLAPQHLVLALGNLTDAAASSSGNARLLGLPLDGSRIDWQRDLALDRDALADVAVVPARHAVMVSARATGAVQMQLFDDATGAALEQRTLACGGSQCWIRPHSLTAPADDYRVLANVYEQPSGRRLDALSVNLRASANLPPAQPAIAGAWYAPATSGEGFVLTWLPESRTLFAPWFTFATGGALEDQSAARWYSLQGTTRLDSPLVELQILRNRGGQFAAPPITQAEVVGSAQLRFTDCDRATLSYRFNDGVEQGRTGSMPLVRIGARVHGCRDAAGVLQPPSLAVADAGGFTTRQSGAWFDPASSGQGLMLEVVPADSAQAGLLFAAWFSYDPMTPPNDSDAQDWLVLQGTLANARDGVVSVPILRVIGGELDRAASGNLFPIGMAEFHFQGCDQLRMDYRFDSGELAAEHAGLSGSQLLARIGGCGVPSR